MEHIALICAWPGHSKGGSNSAQYREFSAEELPNQNKHTFTQTCLQWIVWDVVLLS